MTTSITHDVLVTEYIDQGYSTTGFRRGIERVEGRGSMPRTPTPDAWKIEDSVLTIIEVDVSHPLSAEKLFDYADLWDAVSFLTVRLIVVDRYGTAQEIDLHAWYWRMIRSERPEEAAA